MADWRIHMLSPSWRTVNIVECADHRPTWTSRRRRKIVEASCASCVHDLDVKEKSNARKKRIAQHRL